MDDEYLSLKERINKWFPQSKITVYIAAVANCFAWGDE